LTFVNTQNLVLNSNWWALWARPAFFYEKRIYSTYFVTKKEYINRADSDSTESVINASFSTAVGHRER